MRVVPTKGNLMALKKSLELARRGYDLLDRKRNILIRETMSLIDRANRVQGVIDVTFADAYAALRKANITLGVVDHFAEAVPPETGVDLDFRSVMGVEIPMVRLREQKIRNPYGYQGTNSALDEAYVKFQTVKRLCAELAEIENTVYRLADAIQKTQKRANALRNIVIPRFTEQIKFIADSLEEKDREEFFRLKVIKTRDK